MKKRKQTGKETALLEVPSDVLPIVFDEKRFKTLLICFGAIGIFMFLTLILWGTPGSNALWDDKFLMMHPTYLREGLSLQTVMSPVLTNPALFWRPLGMISLALQFDLAGNMLAVKQLNVLLYALCASLMFVVLIEILWMLKKSLPLLESTGKRGIEWLSFGALASVFLVFLNPSMLQSVHWISGRFILLSCGLVLASFWIVLKSHKAGFWKSLPLMGLALLSYEGTLIAVPLYIALCYWVKRLQGGALSVADHGIATKMGEQSSLQEPPALMNILLGVLGLVIGYVLLRWWALGAPVRFEAGFGSVSYFKDIFEWFSDSFSSSIQIAGGAPLKGLVAYSWFLFWLAFAWGTRYCIAFYQKSLNEFYQLKQEKQKLITVETVNDKNYQVFINTINEQIAHSVKIVNAGKFALWQWGAVLVSALIGVLALRLWTPEGSDLQWGPDLLLFSPFLFIALLSVGIFMLHMGGSIVQYFVAKIDLVKQFNSAVEQTQKEQAEGDVNGKMDSAAPKEFVENARVFRNDGSIITKGANKALFILLTALSLLAFFQITKGLYATQELKARWSNDVALWQSAYEKDTTSSLATMNYLVALHKTGASLDKMKEVGEPHWELLSKREKLTRVEAASIATYGALLNEKEEFAKALGMLSLALVKSESEPLLALNLAHIAAAKERWQESLGALNFSLERFNKTWFNKRQAIAMHALRAQIYANLGDDARSKEDLNRANELKKIVAEQ